MGDWGVENPPVAKVLIGLFAQIGRQPGDRTVFHYQATYTGDEAPAPHLIRPVRTGIALMATLMLLFAYLMARQLAGPWPGLLGPELLFLFPPFAEHAVQVYTDVPQLTFAMAGGVAFLRFAGSPSKGWFALSALLFGLACASKYSSGTFVVGAALYFLAQSRQSWRTRIRRSVLFVGLSFVGFVAVNPYLWRNPVTQTTELVEYWSQKKSGQQRAPRVGRMALRTTPERMSAMAQRSLDFKPRSHPFGREVGSALVFLFGVLGVLLWRRKKWTVDWAPCLVGAGVIALAPSGNVAFPFLIGAGAMAMMRSSERALNPKETPVARRVDNGKQQAMVGFPRHCLGESSRDDALASVRLGSLLSARRDALGGAAVGLGVVLDLLDERPTPAVLQKSSG